MNEVNETYTAMKNMYSDWYGRMPKGSVSFVTEEASKIFNELVPGTNEYKPVPIWREEEIGGVVVKIPQVYSNIIDVMKRIWRNAIGIEYNTNRIGETDKVPAFNRGFWFRSLGERARTKDVENVIQKQVHKLCAEAQCLKNNGECNRACPTQSPIVCEHIIDFRK